MNELPARVVIGPTLLTGICYCGNCGGAMTIRTGKSGRYRYYACSVKARQGETGCKGRAIPMDKLDRMVASHIEERLLDPDRLEKLLGSILDRREDRIVWIRSCRMLDNGTPQRLVDPRLPAGAGVPLAGAALSGLDGGHAGAFAGAGLGALIKPSVSGALDRVGAGVDGLLGLGVMTYSRRPGCFLLVGKQPARFDSRADAGDSVRRQARRDT